MTAYVKHEPWPAITSAIGVADGHVYAAIGYIGADPHHLLPLGAEGHLVCDTPQAAVKNGFTNLKALYKFLDDGVEVFSFPGLHAKVVVLARRAFVGSANTSKNSEKRLSEAVLETTDTNEIRKLREFVTDLCVNPNNRSKVKELKDLFGTDRAALPDISDWGVLPTRTSRLVVLGLTKKKGWSKSELRRGKRATKQLSRRHGNTSAVSRSMKRPSTTRSLRQTWSSKSLTCRRYRPVRWFTPTVATTLASCGLPAPARSPNACSRKANARIRASPTPTVPAYSRSPRWNGSSTCSASDLS